MSVIWIHWNQYKKVTDKERCAPLIYYKLFGGLENVLVNQNKKHVTKIKKINRFLKKKKNVEPVETNMKRCPLAIKV